jgi:branched-chain amino acid transport system permease protein
MIAQLIINGIIAGAAYSLIAVGFVIVYRTTHLFHFAHGGMYAFGAYMTFLFKVQFSFPLLLAASVSVILTALLGGMIEIAVYRPLRRKRAARTVLLIASLGLLILIQDSLSLCFGDEMRAIGNGKVTEGIPVLGGRITPIQLTMVCVSAALYLIIAIAVRFTTTGKKMRAVSNDRILSEIVGIESDNVLLLALVVGSALSAAAATLVALDTNITPTMGFSALLMAVVAAVVGGMDSIEGCALGGLLIGMAQNIGVWKLSTQWQDAIVFTILIVFLLIRPQGFLGTVSEGVWQET